MDVALKNYHTENWMSSRRISKHVRDWTSYYRFRNRARRIEYYVGRLDIVGKSTYQNNIHRVESFVNVTYAWLIYQSLD